MKLEITQEVLSILLFMLVMAFFINFTKGCWDYKAAVKIAELHRGLR